MGWCSATDIMDTALAAAEAVVVSILKARAEDSPGSDIPFDPAANDMDRRAVDTALRPFVAKLAEELREGGWDCIEESDYFNRFPQEMLGHDDLEHRDWLVRQIQDHDDLALVSQYAQALVKHVARMEEKASG